MGAGATQPVNESGSDETSPRPRPHGIWRNVVLPVVAIAAIAAAIWWLEYRPTDDSLSTTGVRYGPLDLPMEFAPAGMQVGPQESKLAPDFLLETLDGEELRLSDLRGRAVVINFWATWCKPCRKEIPQLIDAYNRYRDQGLIVLGVNLQEGRSIAQPFAEDFGMNFPILLDRTGRVADEYRLLGLPTTYFVDRQGIVRSIFTGPFLEKTRGTSVQAAIEQDELTKRIEEIVQ